MKLYKAQDSWILTTEQSSLWFNRRSLTVYAKNGTLDIFILIWYNIFFNKTNIEPITDQFLASSAWDASLESDVYGYIGQLQVVKGIMYRKILWLFYKRDFYFIKISAFSIIDGLHWLIFVKNQQLVCRISDEHEIYRITDILIQPFDIFNEVNYKIFIIFWRKWFV